MPSFSSQVSAVGLTTKGDILTYATALTRLAVGTNGAILTSNSNISTGLQWRLPHMNRKGAYQTVTSGTFATLTAGSIAFTGNDQFTVFYARFIQINAANDGSVRLQVVGNAATLNGTTLTVGAGKIGYSEVWLMQHETTTENMRIFERHQDGAAGAVALSTVTGNTHTSGNSMNQAITCNLQASSGGTGYVFWEYYIINNIL